MGEMAQFLRECRDEKAKIEGEIAARAKELENLGYLIERLERRLGTPLENEAAFDVDLVADSVAHLSIIELAEKVLSAKSKGLTMPALLAEFRKLGWQSHSVNPANSVNSSLHRKGLPFRKRGGRWIVEERAVVLQRQAETRARVRRLLDHPRSTESNADKRSSDASETTNGDYVTNGGAQ